MQWHWLDHMQTICTLLQADNHTNTSSLNFCRPDALPDAEPTVSTHWRQMLYVACSAERSYSTTVFLPQYVKCIGMTEYSFNIVDLPDGVMPPPKVSKVSCIDISLAPCWLCREVIVGQWFLSCLSDFHVLFGRSWPFYQLVAKQHGI